MDAPTPRPSEITLPTPGVPVLPLINWRGLRGLYVKEVKRFFKVQLQTIWAPALTTLLYLVIFTLALGSGNGGRSVMGHGFATFIAPGLIMMGMMTNAFANASFALMVGKVQGTIVDYLMPPLSTGELLTALTAAAVTRALLVGMAMWIVMLFWPGVDVIPDHMWAVLWFGIMGSVLLALLGVLSSLWAEKFDHNAAVTNFVVQPLSLLSGTFYSVDAMHGIFRDISHLNPFFYVISGFRYGFIGTTDSPLAIGAVSLVIVNLLLGWLCYVLLRKGWRGIKA